MNQKLTIKEAAKAIGLSEYAIRIGVKQGRIPHIRTSGNKGKILLDATLLEESLKKEAIENIIQHNNSSNSYGEMRQVQA